MMALCPGSQIKNEYRAVCVPPLWMMHFLTLYPSVSKGTEAKSPSQADTLVLTLMVGHRRASWPTRPCMGMEGPIKSPWLSLSEPSEGLGEGSMEFPPRQSPFLLVPVVPFVFTITQGCFIAFRLPAAMATGSCCLL